MKNGMSIVIVSLGILIGFFFDEEWPDPPVHNWANVYWNIEERSQGDGREVVQIGFV